MKLSQEGHEFKVSLGSLVRSCLKTEREREESGGRERGRERKRERERALGTQLRIGAL